MTTASGNLDYFVGKRVEYTADSSRRQGGECVGWTVDEKGHGYLIVNVPGVGVKQWALVCCVCQ